MEDANKMWELAHFVAVTRPGYSSPDGVKLPEGKVDTLEIPALAISSTDVRRRAEHGEPSGISYRRRGAIHRQTRPIPIEDGWGAVRMPPRTHGVGEVCAAG